jgi:hypothetical protein
LHGENGSVWRSDPGEAICRRITVNAEQLRIAFRLAEEDVTQARADLVRVDLATHLLVTNGGDLAARPPGVSLAAARPAADCCRAARGRPASRLARRAAASTASTGAASPATASRNARAIGLSRAFPLQRLPPGASPSG